MIIHERNINELIPYENNPRDNDKAVSFVKESIKEFGFKVPLVITKDNIIVTGHTRLKAAKELGLQKVPCILADDLNEEQIKAYRIADNKTAELATWDFERLDIEIEELQNSGIDLSEFGFDLQEPELEDDSFDVEAALLEAEEEIPDIKEGDLFRLGKHTLMCGDSTSKKDFKILMGGAEANLVITDPPYNVDYTGGTGLKIVNDNMEDSKFRSFLLEAYKRMFENMALGAPIYVFHADTEGGNFRQAFKESGLKLAECLVWVKNTFVLGRQDYHWRHEPILYGWKEGAAHPWYGNRDKDTVIEDDRLNLTKANKTELIEVIKELQEKLYNNSTIIFHDKPLTNSEHPTMKPVKLIGKLIHNSSQKGDTILDSFGGSGSTLIAAEQSGRICYTMELDPRYCDVIIKRWEEFTGEKAVKVRG